MTPETGADALREAARRESAAFYGGTLIQFDEPLSVFAARAEAELEAANQRRQAEKELARLIGLGVPVSQLIDAHGFTLGEVRAAVKHLNRKKPA